MSQSFYIYYYNDVQWILNIDKIAAKTWANGHLPIISFILCVSAKMYKYFNVRNEENFNFNKRYYVI